MAYLADVNVLVALLHARHSGSRRAVAWLTEQEEPGAIHLCRVVQMGVLRVLTNRAWMKEEVLSAADVWRAWDTLLSDDRFAEVGEPRELELVWRKITRGFEPGRCAETDSYLAAFAVAAGYQFVSFDRGLERFPELDLVLLR